MDFLESLILGIVEGLTEFLPISSTFHLIFVSRFLKIQENDFVKLFHVFIQSGAILSVLFLYFKKLKKDLDLVIKTLIAFVPTAVLGAILYRTIKKTFFESYFLMIAIFILVGILFFIFEILVKKNIIHPRKTISELSSRDAILVGFFQAFSFFPGVSRAGAVILAMMGLGYRRADSAIFSFILSIPTMFSASLYDLFKTREALISSSQNVILLGIGFVTAFVVAMFAVRWLISYLQKNTLRLFGTYRFILGLIVLVLCLLA